MFASQRDPRGTSWSSCDATLRAGGPEPGWQASSLTDGQHVPRRTFRKIRTAIFSAAGRALDLADREGYAVQTLLHGEYEQSISQTILFGSRSALHATTIHHVRPRSSSRLLPDLALLLDRDRKAPCSVYICTDALEAFWGAIEGRTLAPFTLVSGDSDVPVAEGRATVGIARHPSLVAWFAQNAGMAAKTIVRMPIGLDFHSAWNNRKAYGAGPLMPANQERDLFQILGDSPLLEAREPRGYCDWHFHLGRGDRKAAQAHLTSDVAHYCASRLPRRETWAEQSRFRFVFSPLGAGWDCHRTWEALALGAIPVISASPITPLFADLPVVVIEDWRAVTPSFLEEAFAKLHDKTYDFSPMFRAHWAARIAGIGAPRLPRMRLSDLRLLLTAPHFDPSS